MLSLTANEAKTQFGKMLINAQSEPIEIVKNGTSIAVLISAKEYQKIEAMKLAMVKSRFDNIEENELVSGDDFINQLESGAYD